jgi:hypothetical protein
MRGKTLIALSLQTLAVTMVVAQPGDSLPVRNVYRYLGIQANALVQQFISFNSNMSINTNPYVFAFSKADKKTGKGFSFGTGFNISNQSKNDGVASVEEQNVNLAFRLGIERKFFQEDRFIPFYGCDIGFGVVYHRLSSRLIQTIPTFPIVVESTRAFAGPSAKGGVMLKLSRYFMLGTEFFFNIQVSIETNRGFFSGGNDPAPFSVGFQVPTALFLVFRY